MTDILFHYRPATDEEHNKTVQYLRAHTEAAVGMEVKHEPFSLLAYEGKELVGSIIGKIYFKWLHVDLIWVADAFQRRGIGRHLMTLAASKAKEIGLNGIEVWTQSWQAPAFYRKLGYTELATLEDFTPGRKRHVFRLNLSCGDKV